MIKFARPRWNYDSYTDYWTLVTASGFDVCYVDEVDVHDKDAVYIISPMNGEWRPHIDAAFPSGRPKGYGAQLITWNLERPGGSGSLAEYVASGTELIERGYADVIWVSDQDLARDTGWKYVTMGGHPALGEPGPFEGKKYDVIHLSCYSNTRSALFHDPSHPKSNWNGWTIAPNGWGEERHRNLQQSRYMLSLHQDQFEYMEPLRYILAAMYGLIVIADPCNIFPYQKYVIPIKHAEYWMANYCIVDYRSGLYMREFMLSEYPFRSCVERSV